MILPWDCAVIMYDLFSKYTYTHTNTHTNNVLAYVHTYIHTVIRDPPTGKGNEKKAVLSLKLAYRCTVQEISTLFLRGRTRIVILIVIL